MGSVIVIPLDKSAQRQLAKQYRQDFVESLSLQDRHTLSEKLMDKFLESFPLGPQHQVTAYWPLLHEADTRPLLNKLDQMGLSLALPCAEKDAPLTFYKWQPGDPLTHGSFQVQEPRQKKTVASSFTHMIIPLLAFDSKGQRLGYGQGHYDRTLSQLRQETTKRPLFIGIGYMCQRVDEVPSDPHDIPLDAVVTQDQVFHF